MAEYKLYYATNRNHIGDDRWHPQGYGKKFSDDGMENLRFGVVTVSANAAQVQKHLDADKRDGGTGDGEALGDYLAKCAESAKIAAYPESLDKDIAESAQPNAKLGSKAMFAEIQADMLKSSDVVIYIHGFNLSWHSAVGSGLALQLMLQSSPLRDLDQNILVVLFSWPSDGLALPYVSYKSDRSEATGSGAAAGRAFLKARDYLANLRVRAKAGGHELCGQDIHLLCHSMGNFLLQSALARMAEHTPGSALPRIFEHVFLCAPDVDDTALEPDQPLNQVHEVARSVTVYHNTGDTAMVISDVTKGNPDRLGGHGAARPTLLHSKIHQVDCTPIVHGIAEHSYCLTGHVNADIRASIDGWTQDDIRRRRAKRSNLPNVWEMV